MTTLKADVFVSHIGLNRVNLGGNDVDYYVSLPNTEVVDREIVIKGSEKLIRTVILNFESKEEMVDFLQKLVDLGIRFTDNEKSLAYMEASRLKEQGDLKGAILGC